MRTLLFVSFLLSCQWLGAQTFSINGTVSDETGAPLPGATVTLQQVWGEDIKSVMANDKGGFTIENVGKGGYAVKIFVVGYEALKKQVTVKDKAVEMGALRLKVDPKTLSEVQVNAKLPIAVQKDDTLQFNADAFKVMKDADAQDLVEKIPTVTNENGTLKAQGEKVEQVLVDGKTFFGNDPSAALKNLPAEVIDKVQIFDAQSEQSRFTGFNDGTTVKTINIVTKAGMRNGQFGKVYGGYGYQDKYQLGGNINYFDGDRRLSLIGMSNNINVQNFAPEDILGVMGGGGMRGGGGGGRGGGPGGPGGGQGGNRFGGGAPTDFLVSSQGGITTTHAVGFNYSDKWGKKVDVQGSYFLNSGNNDATENLYRTYLSDADVNDIYAENSGSNTKNTNHRANFRLEYQIDSSNSLLLRPRVSVQLNQGSSNTIGNTTFNTELLNESNNSYASDLTGVNFSNSLLWRHKFHKKGRTLSLDLGTGYAPKKGNSEQQSINGYYNTPVARIDSLDQQTDLDVNSWNGSGNLEYTEPAGKNGQVLLNYRASYQQESSDRQTFDYSDLSNRYDLLNIPLSNVFSNDYITHQGGAGYTYSKGRDVSLSFRVNTQWANLANDQTFPKANTFDHTFFNVLPSAMLRFNLSQYSNIRFSYRANTQLPSVEQLQNVVNNNNPLQLTAGNPDLKQAEQHNLFLRYQKTNSEKASVFFGMIGGGFTRDYIGNNTFFASKDNPIFADLDIQPGAQLTLPVNLDGYYTARSFASFGFPVKKIKCNLNFDLNYNYSRTPGLVNAVLNYSNNQSIGAGITLASNISQKLDFTLSTRPSWNKGTNSLQSAANSEYLSESTRLRFNWQIIEGFVLRTDLTNNLYSGLSAGYDQSYWLWNLGIGKKLFKNERGEITLAVNDLLNQNRNISRTVTESYIEDTQTNALTRFVMLSFTYNIRNFNTGKAGSQQPRSEEERRRMMWMGGGM